MVGHKGISANRSSIERRTGSVTDSEKLFHAEVLFASKFKLNKFRLTGEVVLIDTFIVKGTGIDLIKLLTFNLIVDQVRIRQFNIVQNHESHCYFMFIVGSAKAIVELSHLSSKMTASQRCIDVFQAFINTPASLIRNR